MNIDRVRENTYVTADKLLLQAARLLSKIDCAEAVDLYEQIRRFCQVGWRERYAVDLEIKKLNPIEAAAEFQRLRAIAAKFGIVLYIGSFMGVVDLYVVEGAVQPSSWELYRTLDAVRDRLIREVELKHQDRAESLLAELKEKA